MKDLNKIISEISNLEMSLCSKRDYDTLTKEESQLIEMLNFCYELLARSEISQCDQDNTVPDFDENGEEIQGAKIYRFGLTQFEAVESVIKKIERLDNPGACVGF